MPKTAAELREQANRLEAIEHLKVAIGCLKGKEPNEDAAREAVDAAKALLDGESE